jgi:hypothetical protein
MFFIERGGSGGLGSEAHGLGYSAKKVELTSFPEQPRIPAGVSFLIHEKLIHKLIKLIFNGFKMFEICKKK